MSALTKYTSPLKSMFHKIKVHRTGFWTFIVISYLFFIIAIIGMHRNYSEPALWCLIITSVFIRWLAVVFRLNDLGNSKWFGLLTFVPIINFFLSIYCGFFKDKQCVNS